MIKRMHSRFDEVETGLQVDNNLDIFDGIIHHQWISLPIKYFYFYRTNLQSIRSPANCHESVNRDGYSVSMGRIEIRKQEIKKGK